MRIFRKKFTVLTENFLMEIDEKYYIQMIQIFE
jgi:hypothetical protein